LLHEGETMDAILLDVNWSAVIVGAIAAFALGMVWFGPLFGRVWAAGSHGITRPERPPVLAMAVQLAGTFLMAWVIGATATVDALVTAVCLILAIAALQVAGGLFSQKSAGAALVDGGFVLAMGVVMIATQGLL
jgi:hypothetical protein